MLKPLVCRITLKKKIEKISINLGDGLYQCFKCEKQFTSRKNHVPTTLKRHYHNTHGDIVYKCRQCTFSTKNKYERKNHCHNKCNQCKKDFDSKPYFQKHIKENHEHICETCDAAFVHRYELKLHTKIIHEGKEKQFKCEICDQYVLDMKGHLTLQHAHFYSNDFKRAMKTDDFKRKITSNDFIGHKFSCKNCSSKFRSKHELKNHKQTHKKQRNKRYIQKVIVKYY